MTVEEELGKKTATEETLQSIDSTLKRIEEIILNQLKPKTVSIDISKGNANNLVEKNT